MGSNDDLRAAVLQLERARSAIDAVEGHCLAELEARDGCDIDLGQSTISWLKWEGHLPGRVAAGRVRVANKLRRELDGVDRALGEGRISFDHARVLTSAANPRVADAHRRGARRSGSQRRGLTVRGVAARRGRVGGVGRPGRRPRPGRRLRPQPPPRRSGGRHGRDPRAAGRRRRLELHRSAGTGHRRVVAPLQGRPRRLPRTRHPGPVDAASPGVGRAVPPRPRRDPPGAGRRHHPRHGATTARSAPPTATGSIAAPVQPPVVRPDPARPVSSDRPSRSI